ncbi:MAG: winged helix-turn-helix transcriptional regulator [Leptolinea sp.]|nr:winged helix-turn-helix transcriptional regulator [Leptolinea sp.]
MKKPGKTSISNAGWKIVQSMPMELDAALGIAGRRFGAGSLSTGIVALRQSCPTDWMEEWHEFYGTMTWFANVLETASLVSGVLEESDYSLATMAIRQTTLDDAIKKLRHLINGSENEEGRNLSPEDTFIQLFLRYRRSAYAEIKFSHPQDPLYENRLKREMQFCTAILQGGSLHDRYWHWLDRYYFEVYRPWRENRQPLLLDLEQKLLTMLGTTRSEGAIPNIGWLSDVNPGLRYPEIKSAIQNGRLFVNFWLEPFEFADTFLLLPGKIYLAFAEPGQMYQDFLTHTRKLAEQVQALADPTRLIILRLIRTFSMTNTDMAAYLGLSRPTVSIHAKVLREAGLIRSWEEGRITRHEIEPNAVKTLFGDLELFLDLPDEK